MRSSGAARGGPDRGIRHAPIQADVIAAAAPAPLAAAAPSLDRLDRAELERRLDMLADWRRGDLDGEDD